MKAASSKVSPNNYVDSNKAFFNVLTLTGEPSSPMCSFLSTSLNMLIYGKKITYLLSSERLYKRRLFTNKGDTLLEKLEKNRNSSVRVLGYVTISTSSEVHGAEYCY